MQTKLISRYTVNGEAIFVETPYAAKVAELCRGWGGTWNGAAWVLHIARLKYVQEFLGKDQDDLVEVEVEWESEEVVGDQYIRVGGYVLCGRRARDSRVDMHAALVRGSVPRSGGSVKNPRVDPSSDAAWRFWCPRDFARKRNLTIVTDPRAETAPETAPKTEEQSLEVRTRMVVDLMKSLGVSLEDVQKAFVN